MGITARILRSWSPAAGPRTRAVLAIGALLFAGSALAQEGRALILGRISDSSGASIPGAAVEVVNRATGVRFSSKSNPQGHYEVPFLPPGVYRLSIEAPGFKKLVRENIELRVGDRLKLDFALQIGEVVETVTVTAETPLIEAATASLGQVTDRRRIVDLPLSGGNAITLARLAPGVTYTGVPNHPSLLRAVGAAVNFTVAGTPAGNSQYTVDGALAMSGTGPAFMPPAEMVEEFKVSTAAYDASAGYSPGASVSFVLKSGTNQLHGALYWFHNNNVLQGLDLFQRQQLYDPTTGPVTTEKKRFVAPQHVINRYGGAAYGPVWIPKLFDGRNRTFWSYGYEGFIRPSVERGNWFFTVPTLRQRQGDFSELLRLGPTYQVYDPATTTPASGGRYSRQPFPGNVIPTSRLDPLAQKLLKYWPEPNVAGRADGSQNYFRPPRSRNEMGTHTGRFDHNASQRQRISGRFNYNDAPFTSGQVFPNEVTGNTEDRANLFAGLDDVITLSPRAVLSVRSSFTRYKIETVPLSGRFDLIAAGFDPRFVAFIDPQGRFVPGISITGHTGIGGAAPSSEYTNYAYLGADCSWVLGNHTVRGGAEFRVYRAHNYQFTQATPTIGFDSTWTVCPLDNSPAAPIGLGLASFMLGLPATGTMRINSSYAMQSTYTAIFVQDEWRLARRLMLSAGLRHEYFGPVTERFNRAVRGFDFTSVNPIDAAAAANYSRNPIPEIPVGAFRSYGGLLFAGVGGQARGLWDPVYANLAPRIGLAWQLSERASLRAGYGWFFVPRGADRTPVIQTGFSRATTLVASEDYGRTFIASLANPFPRGPLAPLGAAGGLMTNLGQNVSFYAPRLEFGYAQRWSLTVQRELPGRLVVEIGYLGNRSTRLTVNREWDPVPAGYLSRSGERDQRTIDHLSARVANPYYPLLPGTSLGAQTVARSQLLRPYPHFTGVLGEEPQGYSYYHSLQIRTERRLTQGLTAQVGYTWSKWMDATTFLNPTDALPEKVIAAADRPQRLTFSGIWEVPLGKGKFVGGQIPTWLDAIIGGWQFQGIYEAQSGPPIGFGNIIFRGNLHDLVLPISQRTPSRWFNIDAGFERDPARQLAWNIRQFPSRLTGLRAKGLNVWNLSGVKYFRLGERLRVQLRSEWLNAMNHTHLASPNTSPTSPLFGTVTSAPGYPRQIYFGLKLTF